MKPALKILLLAEVVICFGPAFLILVMGFVVIPVAFQSLVNGDTAGVCPGTRYLMGSFKIFGLKSGSTWDMEGFSERKPANRFAPK